MSFSGVAKLMLCSLFSAKGERVGSDGEEELEEITDSAEESEENEEHAQPTVTTTQVTTPTPSVRHTGRPGMVIKLYQG